MNLDIPSEFVEFPWLVIKHSQYSVKELARLWVYSHFLRYPVGALYFPLHIVLHYSPLKAGW